MNLRTLVANTLKADAELTALGIKPDNVFQAESADNPPERPFITIRFGETARGIGPINRKDLSVWAYGDMGNFDNLELISKRVGVLLSNLEQVQLDSGWLMKFDDIGMGGDFFDDGYNALVVPYRLRAVGNGF